MNFERLFDRIAPEQRGKTRRIHDTRVTADGLVDPDLLAAQPREQSLSDETTSHVDQMEEDTIELTVVRDISQPDSDVTVLRARTAATIKQPAASPDPGDR